MAKDIWDVIVVGAGPAGSTAANEIAKAGYKTLLIEREKSPGLHNSCGGGIGYFLKDLFELPEEICKRDISKVRLDLGTKSKLYESNKPLYISVLRPEFDRFLAERAVSNGAELRLQTKALDYDPLTKTLTCMDRPSRTQVQFKGRLFIFADGPRTIAWKSCRVGLPAEKPLLVGIARELHAPGHTMDTYEFIFDEINLPYGYLWVFPKGDTINVGVGGPMEHLRGKIDHMLDDWLATRPDLKDLPVKQRTSGMIPGFLSGKLHGAGVMAVGDAGGFLNPLTGGGIFLGMKSAQLASRTAIEALQAGRDDSAFLARYTHRVKFGPIYSSVKFFDMLVKFSQNHREKTGRPMLGKIFLYYSDLMFHLLKVIKDV
jgi:digeranylgeranylglycerophospholipid reductase